MKPGIIFVSILFLAVTALPLTAPAAADTGGTLLLATSQTDEEGVMEEEEILEEEEPFEEEEMTMEEEEAMEEEELIEEEETDSEG